MTQTVISNSDLLSQDNIPNSTLGGSARAEATSEAAAPVKAASEQVIADRESADEASFRFVHSHGFAELLEAIGATLLVSTYQAGKLVAFVSSSNVRDTAVVGFNKNTSHRACVIAPEREIV